MNKDLEQTELKSSYNSIKTELNDDAISRQAVLDGLASIAKAKAKSDAQKSMMGRTMFFVEQLPSVSTEKTGYDGEVIKELKELEYYNRPFDNSAEEAEVATRKAQAVDMAIKALEREPYISEDGTLTVYVEDGSKVSRVLVCGDNHFGGLYYPDQELCEDAISRQAAIDAIENEQKKIMRSDWAIDQAKFSAMSEIRALIADLPSVSTEKTGRWITQWNPAHQKEYYYCSECREEYSYDGETGIKMNDYKFCPNCGAKMEVEE